MRQSDVHERVEHHTNEARRLFQSRAAPKGIEMTTSPAPIPHRHAPHWFMLVGITVLAFAGIVATMVLVAVHDNGTPATSSSRLTGSGVAATQTRTTSAFTAVDLAGGNTSPSMSAAPRRSPSTATTT